MNLRTDLLLLFFLLVIVVVAYLIFDSRLFTEKPHRKRERTVHRLGNPECEMSIETKEKNDKRFCESKQSRQNAKVRERKTYCSANLFKKKNEEDEGKKSLPYFDAKPVKKNQE